MEADALVGRALAGRFRLDRSIGRGGMATVYAGHDLTTGAEIAVKVLKRELSRDPMVAKRFEREAKAALALDNDHIIKVFAHGVDGDETFIAMELAPGIDLLKALAEERPMGQARATAIVAQVCDALAAAHAQGIVHRDLKPENVMLSGERGRERVKVLDFGIAKILEAKPQKPGASADDPPSYITRTALTRVGTIVGTPAYMSPEQCRGGEVDGRSDLYACGVLLYQLLTGELPFTGETPLHTAMRHIHAPPRPPTELRRELHPTLEQVVLKALSKWPGERHQSAEALRQELLAVRPHLPDADPAEPETSRSAEPARAVQAEPTSQLVGGALGATSLRAVRLGGQSAVGGAPASPSSPPPPPEDDDDDDDARTFLRAPELPIEEPVAPRAAAEARPPGSLGLGALGSPRAQLGGPKPLGRATQLSAGQGPRVAGLGAAPLRTQPLQASDAKIAFARPTDTTRDAPAEAPNSPSSLSALSRQPTTPRVPRSARATETGLTPTGVTHTGAAAARKQAERTLTEDEANATYRIEGGPAPLPVERGPLESMTNPLLHAGTDGDVDPPRPASTTLVMEDPGAAQRAVASLLARPEGPIVIEPPGGARDADPLRALRATARAMTDEPSNDSIQALKSTMKMTPQLYAQIANAGPSGPASVPPPAAPIPPPFEAQSGVMRSPLQPLSSGGSGGWSEPTKITTRKKSGMVGLLQDLPGTTGLLIGVGLGLGLAAGAVIAVLLWR